MDVGEGTSNVILSLIDNGSFIYIKCVDNSEKFLCKEGDIYKVSDDRNFNPNLTIIMVDSELIKSILSNIRGYGIYVPQDYDCIQTMINCGCDS